LPEDLRSSYQRFMTAVERAASRGETAEDLTAGHPMMADREARAYPPEFISFASSHLALLRDVLRNAAESEQRATAAAVLNYAPNKKGIVDDLQYAVQDPDESVRANAIRSLTAIGVLAVRQPGLGIKVSPTWFIELLNSIVLSDRAESAKALLTLTDRGDAAVLGQIRERAIPALTEMARWKTPRYALPPFLLLGRVAGIGEAELHRRWEKGDREAVIGMALGNPAKKK
jgi:HEAT repeat protein